VTSLLNKPLTAVKRKIQLERTARGLAVGALVLLLFLLGATAFLATWNFPDNAIAGVRIILAGLVLVLLWKLLISPWIFRPSDQRIARFLEERYPDLQDRLSTAVEIGSPGSRIHPDLRSLILRDAYRKLKKIPVPRFYWPRRSTLSLVSLALVALTFNLLYLAGPMEFSYTLSRLASPASDETPPPLYRVEVTPGNRTVPERSDLEIGAASVGFEAAEALLFVQYANYPRWESSPMYSTTDGNRFTFQLFDIRESLDYYVEADGIRSATFRIEISEVPRVESFTITLNYPAYTGISPSTIENEYVIRALAGTEVVLNLITDQPVAAGLLKFENSDELSLTRAGSHRLSGTFPIQSDDYFQVFLTDSTGVTQPGTGEFTIESLRDQSPSISFNFPGRDRRVTNIEEVFAELEVEDDYGISDIVLRYSINGEEEREIELPHQRGTRKAITSHTFYLEEYGLLPGDFVSYYGEAQDASQPAATDIYFLEVTPFERQYYQSQQSGNAGAGEQGMQLSAQQKQIVIAVFSMTRDRDRLSPEERRENSQTLGLMQQRLGLQVQTIVERIRRRSAAAVDPRIRKMSEYMEKALEHMALSETALNEINPEAALPEAQKALQQLLKSESLFNQMQVSFSEEGGGGTSPEELADLVDLELDRTKNMYETLRQNRRFQQEKAMDEALEKLKELARRQEQEVERQRQQARSGSSGKTASNGRLLEEVEELARRLARLSRRQQQQELEQISRQLQRAARDMKNSLQSGSGDQQSMQAAEQAMDRLNQAARRLNRQRRQQVQEQFASIKQQATDLLREQEAVLEGIREMEREFAGQQPNEKFYDKLRPLYWQKLQLQENLQQLESDLHRFARRLEGEEPETARKIKQAGLSIRDERLPEKMEEGSNLLAGGLVNLARHQEEAVEENLQSLNQQILRAENSLGTGRAESQEERLRRALHETGELVDKLESLQEMIEAQQLAAREDGKAQGSGRASKGLLQQSEAEIPPQEGRTRGSRQIGSMFGGPGTGLNPTRLGKDWEGRLREAKALSRMLRDNPELARQASDLLEQMNNLSPKDILDDPEEASRLRQGIIAGLHQLELDIRRLIQQDGEAFVHLTNDENVPPEFRKLVAEYYRKLSRKKEK